MARKIGQYLEVSGGLFEPDMRKRFDSEVGKGIRAMGKDVEEIGVAATAAAKFIDTGAFISSWQSKFVQQRGAGYAKVAPTDVWPRANRPTRTWLEKGTRRGVKLRPAKTVFAKTRTRARTLPLTKYFGDVGKGLN